MVLARIVGGGMNTLRGQNVSAFVIAFHDAMGRGPTGDEICSGLRLDRSLLPRIVRRLERQGVIARDTVFRPARRPSPISQPLAQP